MKTLKKIKMKLQEKTIKYAQEDIKELSRILNKPNEGELVKIQDIKIKDIFQKPRYLKMKEREEYYKKHKYFETAIVLDDKNYLVDGYTTYLLAKQMEFDYITITRKGKDKQKQTQEDETIWEKSNPSIQYKIITK